MIPTVSPERIIGVRTPELRRLAREIGGREDVSDFLRALPHRWYDEDQLHALLLSNIKDYDDAISLVNDFLPYVDNWATCDQLLPRAFRAHRAELSREIERWLGSEHTYTVRFGVGMLMRHYLDEDFDPRCPERVAALRAGEYYIDMMRAWYFATALAKRYDAVLPFLTERRLDVWTHNKTIRKAVESYRLTEKQKRELRSLSIRQKK